MPSSYEHIREQLRYFVSSVKLFVSVCANHFTNSLILQIICIYCSFVFLLDTQHFRVLMDNFYGRLLHRNMFTILPSTEFSEHI